MNRCFEVFAVSLLFSIMLFGAPLNGLAQDALAPTSLPASPALSPVASPQATGGPLKPLHRSMRRRRPRMRLRRALMRKMTGAGAPKQAPPAMPSPTVK